jgi:hypothetical protein
MHLPDSSRNPTNMKPPHLRPDRIRPGLHDPGIPAGQARALYRRHALEAQQRAFRDLEAGRPTTTPADLAPVRRRMEGGRPNG